jgi:hypothetical protein
MSSNLKRVLLLLTTGGMLLQTQACIPTETFLAIDTVILGAIAGITYFIARQA